MAKYLDANGVSVLWGQIKSKFRTEEQVSTAINAAVAALVDSAPETLDTLKELADNFDGMATQAWVEGKGYLTEHQDISNKLNKLPLVSDTNDPGYGWPYHLFYNIKFEPAADKIAVTAQTITLDNNATTMDFSKEITTATTASAGLMSAADKTKLDGLSGTVSIDTLTDAEILAICV